MMWRGNRFGILPKINDVYAGPLESGKKKQVAVLGHHLHKNSGDELLKIRGLINNSKYRFVWVTDFPLFEYSETEKSFTSSHHPFTMPDIDDLEKYGEQDPEKIRSRAYDVVLNGVEIGGGSIRIHREDIQNKVFRLLKLTDEEIESKFGFLMKALSYGAPPHGGIALGFDRMMMFLLKTDSIFGTHLPFSTIEYLNDSGAFLSSAAHAVNDITFWILFVFPSVMLVFMLWRFGKKRNSWKEDFKCRA